MTTAIAATLLGATTFGSLGLFAIEGALAANAPLVDWKSAPRTEIAGLGWHDSLPAAYAESKATGKPVLVLQMFGRLDDAFC
jgi:hypothetical protein